jgi:hypothetical protein
MWDVQAGGNNKYKVCFWVLSKAQVEGGQVPGKEIEYIQQMREIHRYDNHITDFTFWVSWG